METKTAILRVYTDHPMSVDGIIKSPALADDFTKDVNRLLPPGEALSVQECSRILLNMRRRGGELPAKFAPKKQVVRMGKPDQAGG